MSSDSQNNLYIGLMSGTSMDAVDAALTSVDREGVRVVATHRRPMPEDLRAALLALAAPGQDEIARAGALDNRLARLFAAAALAVLDAAGVPAARIRAIGSHGQTVRHSPRTPEPFTLQIGNPALIAELTGITTVADFRRRDIAAGGEGAPLVPAFHNALFRSMHDNRVVLNIGGMANITILPADPALPVRGFDTGPGNVLLDAWVRRQRGTPMDRDGAWAATGTVHPQLLARLLDDGYFALPPPKSTGREHFHLAWLEQSLNTLTVPPEDVQATLCALTAASIARAVHDYAPQTTEVLACGGGVHNKALWRELETRLDGCRLRSTADCGLMPDWVEAAAFAWLAHQCLEGLPGNLPGVTGARHPVILGAIHPGLGQAR